MTYNQQARDIMNSVQTTGKVIMEGSEHGSDNTKLIDSVIDCFAEENEIEQIS